MKIRLSSALQKSLLACFTTARTLSTLSLFASTATLTILPATSSAEVLTDLTLNSKESKILTEDLVVDNLTSDGTIDGANSYNITINNITSKGGDIIGNILSTVSGSSFAQLTVNELKFTNTPDGGNTTIGGSSTIGILSGTGGITIAEDSSTTILQFGSTARDLVIEKDGNLTLQSDATFEGFENGGNLSAAGYDIVINKVTSQGGDVAAAKLSATSGSTFDALTLTNFVVTAATDGEPPSTVTIGDGTTIDSLSGVGGLTIAEGAKVSINTFSLAILDIEKNASITLNSDTTLDSLTNEGTLNALNFDLVINNATEKGGNIEAKNLTVQTKSSFGTLNLDTLTIQGTASTGDFVTVKDQTEIGEVSGEGGLAIANASSSSPSEVSVGKMTLAGVAGEVAVSIGDYATLTLGDDSNIGIVAGDGSLILAQNASVTVGGFLSENNDTINLTLENNASLTITGDSTIQVLENGGILDAGREALTLLSATEKGGDVTAGALSVVEDSRFDTLDITGLSITGTLSTKDYALVLKGFEGLASSTIELSIDSLEAGKLTVGDYLIIDQQKGGLSLDTITWDKFVITDASKQGILDLVMSGHDVYYEESDGNLQLDVKVATGRTWNTSENFATSSGIEEGDLNYIAPILGSDGKLVSYEILDAVNNIIVDQDTTLDLTGTTLTSDEGKEKVSLNNVSAKEDITLTIKGDGITEDAVSFNNSKVSVFAGDIIAQGVTVSADSSSAGRLELSTLKLEGSRLDIASGENMYIDTLTGDASSELAGVIYITGAGSVYEGSYDEATISTITSDASITATADNNLAVGGSAGEIILTQSYGNEIQKISSSGSNIILKQSDETNLSTATTTLGEASSITKDGKVVVSIDGQKLASSVTTGNSHMTIFTGESISFSSGGTLVISDVNSTGELTLGSSVAEKDLTLLTVSDVAASKGEGGMIELDGLELNKAFTNARFEKEGDNLLVVADQNISFYSDHAIGTTGNNVSGLLLANNLYYNANPQSALPSSNGINKVLNQLDTYITAGNTAAANQLAAALAGSSSTALGSALKGDMDRQLRVIRDRASNFSRAAYLGEIKQGTSSFWMEGMVNDSELDATEYSAGHTLSGYGASVGYDKQVSSTFSIGGAFSAVYGDLTATAADTGAGELNTIYASLYAHINRGRWTNSFAAVVGIADTTLTRTLATSTGDVTAEGTSSGMTYGLSYELGYILPLNRSSSSILQPIINLTYQSTSIDGYTETGDAGLNIDSQDLSYFSFGVGMRYETTVGGKIFNRNATFSLRGLAKFDSGDSSSETQVSLLANPGQSASIIGAEAGNTAYELGVGLIIPVSPRSNIYIDAATEIRDLQTQMNATLGYQISF